MSKKQAVSSGDWKLHFAHKYFTVVGTPGRNGKPSNFENLKPASITQSGIQGIATRHGYTAAHSDLALFDMKIDPREEINVADQRPEVVARLSKLADGIRSELGSEVKRPLECGDSSPLSFSGQLALGTTLACSADFP